MKIAIIGSNSALAKALVAQLPSQVEIVCFSRHEADVFFEMESASQVQFNGANFAIHFEHPRNVSLARFFHICREYENMLALDRWGSTHHILISSLSAQKGNMSRYSQDKLQLEDIFTKYSQSVVRIGLIDSVVSEINPAYKNVRLLLRFWPLKVIGAEKVAFYLTREDDFISFIQKTVTQSVKNFKVNLFSIKIVGLNDLTFRLVGRSRRIYFGFISYGFLLKLLNRLPVLTPFKEKVLNFFYGMSLD